MGNQSKKFGENALNKAFDQNHRNTINFNISRYDKAVEKGKDQFENLELARKRAANIKYKVIRNLDQYLIEFEQNIESRGAKVIWATDANEAVNEILKIANEHEAKKVVKSKSMTTEEIEFNEALEVAGIESLESDLGEYIVQIAGEKPYHIVTPAMHKSKEDIAELFHEKFNTPPDSTPEELTGFVRGLLRKKFTDADIGVTGANFLLAKPGAIALTENEGNGIMSMSFPKVHIVIAGIEKLIPDMNDLGLFWPLLASHGTGQNITVYNSIVTGPKQAGETDGPEEMYVVLLDNGRSDLLAKERQSRALGCIRCGACLNACPVYKNIGGHSYEVTYSGPIGSVITPHLQGMKDYKHLSYASSLCGKCTEVCPVKIPLHELLLLNRNDSVKEKTYPASEKMMMWGWKTIMNSRKTMDMFSGNTKNMGLNMTFKKTWGPRRELPKLAKESFSKQWKKNHK